MELTQKGDAAEVGNFKQLLVTMKWTTAADFDLAAAYEGKDGKKGMVYFGDLGNLNSFPFMQLSGDEGQGDTGGDNEEQMQTVSAEYQAAAMNNGFYHDSEEPSGKGLHGSKASTMKILSSP